MTHWSELLDEPPLLADGPVEGWLRYHGLLVPRPGAEPGDAGLPERINLERPDLVSAGHRAFLRAGAALHRTHTLRANALDLAGLGLAERAEAINNSGAAALRQAIGLNALLAGRIGPVADPRASLAQRQQAYGEQAIYLSDTGADLLILERFRSAPEAELSLRAVADVHAAPALVLLAAEALAHLTQSAWQELGRDLLDAGAEALGVIGAGAELQAGFEALRPLGVPRAVFLDVRPEDSPEEFAQALAELAGLGAAIVGGGAGALPAQIHAAALRLGKKAAE